MPTEDDDADHDVTTTATVTAITTSLPPHPDATNTVVATSLPDDHPERPVKPSNTNAEAQPTATSTESAAAETTTGSSWLPSFLPTFGVSSRTQAWIYGALGLIVSFCAGLGVWLWLVRRRRLRNNPRDSYEFEPLNPSDTAGLEGSREKGAKRRGGELYDAFAGGSDDEEFNDRDNSSLVSADSDEETDDEEEAGRTQGSKRLGGQS
jgi:kexin